MIKKRIWLVLPNNCANFAEEVIKAGGSKMGLYLNCPTTESMKPPITDGIKSNTQEIKLKMSQMDIAGRGAVKLFQGGIR